VRPSSDSGAGAAVWDTATGAGEEESKLLDELLRLMDRHFAFAAGSFARRAGLARATTSSWLFMLFSSAFLCMSRKRWYSARSLPWFCAISAGISPMASGHFWR